MNNFSKTIVIRHRKERLSKCSLRGLEERDDCTFYTYPLKEVPPLEGYVCLSVDGDKELSEKDRDFGLLLLDGTWAYAEKMEKILPPPDILVRRSLPKGMQTAYPRKNDVESGLASVEALFIAYTLLGRDTRGLLDHYYWKEPFLEKNGFSIVEA